MNTASCQGITVETTEDREDVPGRSWPIVRVYVFTDEDGNEARLKQKNGRQYRVTTRTASWHVDGQEFASLRRAGEHFHSEGDTETSEFLLRVADYFLDSRGRNIGRK